MSQRSSLGWLILLATLAVPALLFWNWWARMKAPAPPQSLRPTQTQRLPFSAAPAQAAAPNAPAAASAVAARAQNAPAAAAPAQNPPPPAQAAALAVATPAPSPPAAALRQKAAPVPAPAQQPAPSGHAAAAPAAPSKPGPAAIEYNPSTPRDPTLSPVDYKRRAQEDLRKEITRRETLQAARGAPADPTEGKMIEDRLRVLGIIGNPEGKINAIVNDVIVAEGDKVLGARVKRITSGTVVFEYKKRTFIKRVQK